MERIPKAGVGIRSASASSRDPSELEAAGSVAGCGFCCGASSGSGVKGEFGGRIHSSSPSSTCSSESGCNCEPFQGVDRLNALEADVDDITSCFFVLVRRHVLLIQCDPCESLSNRKETSAIYDYRPSRQITCSTNVPMKGASSNHFLAI